MTGCAGCVASDLSCQGRWIEVRQAWKWLSHQWCTAGNLGLRGGCVTCPLLSTWPGSSAELKDQSCEFEWAFRGWASVRASLNLWWDAILPMSHHSLSLGLWRGKVEGSPDWFCCTGLGISMQVMRPIGIISQPLHLFDDLLRRHCGAVLRWGLYILQSWKTQEVF